MKDIDFEQLRKDWEAFNSLSLKDDKRHAELVSAYELYQKLYSVFGVDVGGGIMRTLDTLQRQAAFRAEGRAKGRRKPLPS